MAGQFGQIAFVVWRESMEALLVIGILDAWLGRNAQGAAASAGRRFLWAGVVLGLALAGILGAVLLLSSEVLGDDQMDYFQMFMVFAAAALILKMVFWIRKHGSGMKSGLEREAHKATTTGNWWGLFILCAIAVAREGSETVVFLYGILATAYETSLWSNLAAGATGLAMAAAGYAILQAGARWFPWPVFFRTTEIMLLLLAASLLVTGLDRAIGLDLVSPLSPPLWDSSWLLDDSQGFGRFLADFAGYRARPELLPALVYMLYWLIVAAGLFRSIRRRPSLAA
ncbi:FTR1 family iron permease [Rhizobium sp. A37_96]